MIAAKIMLSLTLQNSHDQKLKNIQHSTINFQQSIKAFEK